MRHLKSQQPDTNVFRFGSLRKTFSKTRQHQKVLSNTEDVAVNQNRGRRRRTCKKERNEKEKEKRNWRLNDDLRGKIRADRKQKACCKDEWEQYEPGKCSNYLVTQKNSFVDKNDTGRKTCFRSGGSKARLVNYMKSKSTEYVHKFLKFISIDLSLTICTHYPPFFQFNYRSGDTSEVLVTNILSYR